MFESETHREKADAPRGLLPSWLSILLAPVILPLVVLVKLVVWPFEKAVVRGPADVAAILRAYVNRSVSNSTWDDFICVPIADARLESIREYCANLPWIPYNPDDEWLSPDDEATIRGYIAELEGAA